MSRHSIVRSFYVAGKGFLSALRNERNVRVTMAMTALAVALALYFRLSSLEWCVVLICCALVVTTELLNTAIEAVTDLACSEQHPLAACAKDTAAGASFAASCFSIVMGVFIFGPRIWELLGL